MLLENIPQSYARLFPHKIVHLSFMLPPLIVFTAFPQPLNVTFPTRILFKFLRSVLIMFK